MKRDNAFIHCIQWIYKLLTAQNVKFKFLKTKSDSNFPTFAEAPLIVMDLKKHRNQQIIAFAIKKTGGSIDYYTLFKILYFAEKKHLAEFGEGIIDDYFHALPHGPVPTALFDEVKALKSGIRFLNQIPESVVISNHNLILPDSTNIDMDFISESEIECIESSIKENHGLDFGELKEKSHGYAWEINKAGKARMSHSDMAAEDGLDKSIDDYLQFVKDNKRAFNQ